MGMTPAFLLMEDDGAGLAFKLELSFDPLDGFFEDSNRNTFGFRRIQAKREQILAAFGATADGFRLLERAVQIVRGKAAQIVDEHMLVIVGAQQMGGEVLAAAALRGFQDHDRSSGLNPRAVRSRRRKSRISASAARRSASVSGVSGSEPMFAA
ncbi:hypothetical protein ACMYR2_0991 [Nitrobacter sp. TKz-YC01]